MLLTAIALLTASVSYTAGAADAVAQAAVHADIHDRSGAVVGHVNAHAEGKGVTFEISVKGLKPGKHGVHIHSVGKCEAPDFKSAGSHFAFPGQMHGMDNAKGPHLGDMPNLIVKADGAGKLRFHSDLVSMSGGENSLSKAGGTAIVIHDKQDDQKTDPSGASGDRIACGVLF
jgi:Cu-Zn family superoxide dismutase